MKKRAIQIVENSVASSKYENRIVWIRDIGGHVHHALLGACEDYAESNGVVEYWGKDDDGEWRIHVRP